MLNEFKCGLSNRNNSDNEVKFVHCVFACRFCHIVDHNISRFSLDVPFIQNGSVAKKYFVSIWNGIYSISFVYILNK